MTNRRDFLKGFAATLAAAAVIPGTALALSTSDYDRLASQLRDGGVIEGQTFIFYEGEELVLDDLQDVTIRNCTFLWKGKAPPRYLMSMRGRRTQRNIIKNCVFDTSGSDWSSAALPEQAYFGPGLPLRA